eukprot:scaffold7713_cov30-Phaeocystis_antarctica.AAC.1
MPVARSEQGLATIHVTPSGGRKSHQHAITISRVMRGSGSLSREDGDPHRAHLAQDPFII